MRDCDYSMRVGVSPLYLREYARADPAHASELLRFPIHSRQVKGKAAIDVLGARLGKSGGALAQQGLVVACGSILTGAPVLASLFSLVSSFAFVYVTCACDHARLSLQFFFFRSPCVGMQAHRSGECLDEHSPR